MAKRVTPKKPNIFLYVMLLIVALGVMFMLKNCGKSDTDSTDNLSADTIKVGIEYSPTSYYMIGDTLGGFNYDLLRILAKKHNLPVKFYPIVTLQKGLDDLNEGRFDILIAQMPMTSEYVDNYLFTEPIYLDKQVLVQMKDSVGHTLVKSQLDLAGKTVYVVEGSPMKGRLENLSSEIGDTIYIKTDNLYGPEQLFLAVKERTIDFAVINEKIAKEMAKKYPQVSVRTEVSFTQFQPWILSKNEPELRDSLNVWVNDIKSTQEYSTLYNRYFNK